MARNIDDIQREIERTRGQLASTLDQLAERTRPENLVEDAKQSAMDKLRDPKVQAICGVVAAGVVAVIALGVSRSRSRKKDLEALRELLAGE
ncbi:hypothetical protein C1Y63_09265 [Corynebacterium sp. 13CS0277]|uniref:DUF3618 domain-containing protein n=1 Tax=Corynebacterium sp. 13CS0277 TaxID=2071994 RepID=UPI000D024721|nr:DUF3618 domain-containing protein [Corynebacterium sp. 13CS0277]PRQ10820.1 hypothetical protein C1Y63_09265 [Corynebacterium sp. 13CS0277]